MQFRDSLDNANSPLVNSSGGFMEDFHDFIPQSALNNSILRTVTPDVSTPVYILTWVTVTNILLFAVGVSGNAMVIIIVSRVRTMRVPNNFFLVSLSIADLLVLVICQPSALLEFYAKDRWYLGEVMCKIVPFLESTSQKASILTISAISMERYDAICRPLRAQYLCSRSRAVHIIVTLWILAAIVSCPFAGITVLEDAQFYDGSAIKVCRTKVDEVWHSIYIISLMVIFFAIPLLTLVALYVRIMNRLMSDELLAGKKDDRRVMKKLKSRRHSVYMLLAIIVVFFVGLFPARIFTLWTIYVPTEQLEDLGLEAFLNLLSFVRVMIYFNSTLNPVLYSLMSTKFRQSFRFVCRSRKSGQSHSFRYFVTSSHPKEYCVLQTPASRPPSDYRVVYRCKLHMVTGYSIPNRQTKYIETTKVKCQRIQGDLLASSSSTE